MAPARGVVGAGRRARRPFSCLCAWGVGGGRGAGTRARTGGVARGLLVAHANVLNSLLLARLCDLDDGNADDAKGVLDALAPQRAREHRRAVQLLRPGARVCVCVCGRMRACACASFGWDPDVDDVECARTNEADAGSGSSSRGAGSGTADGAGSRTADGGQRISGGSAADQQQQQRQRLSRLPPRPPCDRARDLRAGSVRFGSDADARNGGSSQGWRTHETKEAFLRRSVQTMG